MPDLTGRAVWKLLVRGVTYFLPEWEVTPGSVRLAEDAAGIGLPVFQDRDSGFGLHLRSRDSTLPTDREIYSRGRDVRSFGIVIVGPAASIGSRVVEAAELFRYGRRLIFETLYDTADPASAVAAARAAKNVESVVFLDPGAGVGLCAEAEDGVPYCPLLVRFGDRASGAVEVFIAGGPHTGGRAAQFVKSQT